MKKYIIRWNIGYGDEHSIIDACDANDANLQAREEWKENIESNADYEANEYTREDAIDLGLEEEDEE